MKVFTFLCAMFLLSISTCSNAITITSLNIKWFGLNGEMSNDPGNEERAPSIRKYLSETGLLASDVLIFQEIVDVGLLESKVVGRSHVCQSYDNENAKHQHVVICVKSKYKLEAADEEGYSLGSVSLGGKVRPAVHGIVTIDGRRLHIFGVHLKAIPTFSEWRMKQVQLLTDYIHERGDEPVLIIGDFNAYGEDAAGFSDIFSQDNLSEVTTPEKYSWASASEKYPREKFDRAWSRGMETESAHIVGPCNAGTMPAVKAYNGKVSDHCALSVKVRIPD
jgi:endonuclease/exonuclease/phosphatase family metal-dependent hydrolase